MYKIYIKNVSEIDTSLLSINVLEYLSKFHDQKRYLHSLNAWYLLSSVLLEDFNIDISNKQIFVTPNGKPYIKGMNFSISHSNNLVGVIISDCVCGIDIEMISEHINHSKLSSFILTNKELALYKLNKNKLAYFIKKWTQKEAYLKCFNDGINKLSDLLIECNTKTLKLKDSKGNLYYLSYIVKDHIS